MLIKIRLMELGISGEQMREILAKEYKLFADDGKSLVSKGMYSSSISGKANSDKAVQIRNKCWDYINKHGGKEKT